MTIGRLPGQETTWQQVSVIDQTDSTFWAQPDPRAILHLCQAVLCRPFTGGALRAGHQEELAGDLEQGQMQQQKLTSCSLSN